MIRVGNRLRQALKWPITAAIRIGLRNERVRRLVVAEIGRLGRPTERRTSESTGGVERTAASQVLERVFVDRHGGRHPIDPELRDRLKPGWHSMLDPQAAAAPPTDESLRARIRKAEGIVRETGDLLGAICGSPIRGRILEVGTYDGAVAFELAHLPGTDIVASDLARYYVRQRPSTTSGGSTASAADAEVESQQAVLAALRERVRHLAGRPPGAVLFVEDDIASSALEAGSFDAILSYEVLEHVQQPDRAILAMARLLAPGGLGYHEYNPFFSVLGGHSLCTLDFPWGHARLDADDFERYLAELRPRELEQAMRFYRENLNRLTLADLRRHVANAGLELLALIPWHERTRVPMLTPDVLAETRRTYSTATAEDLLGSYVSLVVRRPTDEGDPAGRQRAGSRRGASPS